MAGIFDNLEPIEFPHEFDIDIDSVVVGNYAHTLLGIEKREQEALEETEEVFKRDLDAIEPEFILPWSAS
jgi:hypothetical protein